MDEKFTYKLQDNILFLNVEGDYSAQEFLDLLKIALNDSRKKGDVLYFYSYSESMPVTLELKNVPGDPW